MRRRRDGEQGYALVAAVASIAVFGLIATTTIETARGAIVTGGAEIDRARAAAAADAGTTLALDGLLDRDAVARWPIDGSIVRRRFGNADLAIRVEDERGKIAINTLDEDEARKMFEALGIEGERLDIVTDSLLDWLDDDDDERPHGAESAYYAPLGIRPANGGLSSIGEAVLIRGFDSRLVAQLERIATTDYGQGSFEPRHASPLAIQVMEGDDGAVDAIDREREAAGERTAIDLTDQSLAGRPLTIAVDVRLDDGARAERREIVELTGSAAAPYVVRASE